MKYERLITRPIWLLLWALFVISAPAMTMAQQDTSSAQPTDAQLELNAEAVGAITSGDYAKAVELLEKANGLGQFNVTWLNLGRAYQKMGACDKARQAYLNVISAPAVKDPSPRLINAKADQYLGELDSECETKTRGEQVAVDDEKEDMTGGEVNESNQQQAAESKLAEPAQPSSNAVAWTLTATGVVVAGAGIGAHVYAESIRDDVRASVETANGGVVEAMSRREALDDEARANTFATVGVSAIVVGTLVTGAGAFLVLTSDDVEAAPSASVTHGGKVSVGFRGRF